MDSPLQDLMVYHTWKNSSKMKSYDSLKWNYGKKVKKGWNHKFINVCVCSRANQDFYKQLMEVDIQQEQFVMGYLSHIF